MKNNKILELSLFNMELNSAEAILILKDESLKDLTHLDLSCNPLG